MKKHVKHNQVKIYAFVLVRCVTEAHMEVGKMCGFSNHSKSNKKKAYTRTFSIPAISFDHNFVEH